MNLVYINARLSTVNKQLGTVRHGTCRIPVNPKYFVFAHPNEAAQKPNEPKCIIMMATGPLEVMDTFEEMMLKLGPAVEQDLAVHTALDQAASQDAK